jgi:glyoxylase-like metal-dependent hydrolase (beta-lactamase superfamily II)
MRGVIHHLNCGTMCPHVGDEIVCHVLLIEGADGLTLVDTGLGTLDLEHRRELGTPFRLITRPKLRRSETAVEQVRGLGFAPEDVRHIVVTHLDVDHAGGLADFPGATVHVFRAEHEALLHPGVREKARYIRHQTAHGPQWAVHDVDGDRWHGFESVRVLPGAGAPDDLLMIPLPGHSRGHTGVAVRDGDGWLLHAGDAYFHHGETRTPPSCPPVLRAFQAVVTYDARKRKANQERLRELLRDHGGAVRTVCAHDATELDRERRARSSPGT